jgi:hypothetical protein
MKKIRFLLVGLVLLNIVSAKAGILTLTGVYQGKNLYIQNPFTGNQKDFCANEVFVNDIKVLTNIQSSAFEIDLSHLKVQEPVTIKITHKDDCKPKILNPQVIKATSSFQFSSFNVDSEHIVWSTKGEKPGGKMFVEHFQYNSWVVIKELPAKGGVIINNYDMKASHNSDLNKYRIKFTEADGQVFYSQIVEFKSSLEKVTFYPTRVSDKITLSRDADYEILDAVGTVIKKGKGKEIDLTGKPSGVYYLNTDNQTNKIFKK